MIERETKRNIEVIWLVNRVLPTYKTIVDFRRDQREAIVGVCWEFIRFCRRQLLGSELLALDGTTVPEAALANCGETVPSVARQAATLREADEYVTANEPQIRQRIHEKTPGCGSAPLWTTRSRMEY